MYSKLGCGIKNESNEILEMLKMFFKISIKRILNWVGLQNKIMINEILGLFVRYKRMKIR